MSVTGRHWWFTPIVRGGTASWLRTAGFWMVLVVSLGIFSLGIAVPDAWGDESASWLAVTRPWGGIRPLATSGDAPLVPYYILIKLVLTVVPLSPLMVMRAISATAAAVTVAALYSLVVRRAGLLPALTAAAMLIALSSFSRYAQEARPYAILAMMSTLSWLAWDTWVRPERALSRPAGFRWTASVRGAVAYVVALAGSVAFQLFGGLNWPAQLLADVTTPGISAGQRLRRTLASAAAMMLALLIVIVPVGIALSNGTGPHHDKVPSVEVVWRTYVRSVTAGVDPLPLIPVLVLAAVGLTAVVLPWPAWRRFADLARVAAIWLVVPLGFAISLALVKRQLMGSRYWTPSLVPLALLAGIGLVVLAELGYRAVDHGRGRIAGPHRKQWGLTAAAVVVAVGLGAVIGAGMPEQLRVRSVGGHGMNISAAYARIEPLLVADPAAKVIITQRLAASVALAQYPDLRSRDILDRVDQYSILPWPQPRSPQALHTDMNAADRIIWLRERGYADAAPALRLTDRLKRNGFHQAALEAAGSFEVMIWQR